MENPFKEGDRVAILRKGIEAEAVVRTTWQHEVQVRVQSGELLWRTVKTILRTLPPVSPENSTPSLAPAASLPSEAPAADGADSHAGEEEDATETHEPDQQGDEPEPLVVIDLSAPKKERRKGQKRAASRRKK